MDFEGTSTWGRSITTPASSSGRHRTIPTGSAIDISDTHDFIGKIYRVIEGRDQSRLISPPPSGNTRTTPTTGDHRQGREPHSSGGGVSRPTVTRAARTPTPDTGRMVEIRTMLINGRRCSRQTTGMLQLRARGRPRNRTGNSAEPGTRCSLEWEYGGIGKARQRGLAGQPSCRPSRPRSR